MYWDIDKQKEMLAYYKQISRKQVDCLYELLKDTKHKAFRLDVIIMNCHKYDPCSMVRDCPNCPFDTRKDGRFGSTIENECAIWEYPLKYTDAEIFWDSLQDYIKFLEGYLNKLEREDNGNGNQTV